MEERVEFIDGGLKCDNVNCDWADPSIKMEEYKNYLNSPCPKCGDNILTEEDYENVKKLFGMVDFVNNLSEEEMKELRVDMESSGIDPKEKLIMTINTHKKLTVESIEKLKD